MPTSMKNDTGIEINEKLEPPTLSARIALGLNPEELLNELAANPIAARINPSIVPIRAIARSCIHTIAQSALPISSANVCADGFVSTLIY